ncbi:hypothetical protein [Halorhodospira halophila]|uniref:hypothetical protein n=1 Tax=Halorhodospira halophila TaxID=1053 RepID=UPI00191469A2|nr:hypothetical protein [Halorhodospira halophila]MBK5936086.1 hypothetical protein [Halorhodospira halophila]
MATGKNLYLLLYATAALICVSISVILSYHGYYAHLEGLTVLFAGLLGVLLFGTDMMIRQHRVERRPLTVPLGFFVLVAVFSGASNFNYLYTNFMAEDIAEREVGSAIETYRDDLLGTREALGEIPAVQRDEQRRREVVRELGNLEEQVMDPLRPGCGERCRGHMDNIHEVLGGAPTDLAVPSVSAPEEDQQVWLETYRNAVINDFMTGAATTTYLRSRELRERIDGILERTGNPLEALEAMRGGSGMGLLSQAAAELPRELQRTSAEIERRSNALLPEDMQVEHEKIDADLSFIGEIPASFSDGFVERPNVGVTVVSLLLGVFVDLAPVLFALVLFGPEGAAGAATAASGRGSRTTSRRVTT